MGLDVLYSSEEKAREAYSKIDWSEVDFMSMEEVEEAGLLTFKEVKIR